jgi:hypothetical protein
MQPRYPECSQEHCDRLGFRPVNTLDEISAVQLQSEYRRLRRAGACRASGPVSGMLSGVGYVVEAVHDGPTGLARAVEGPFNLRDLPRAGRVSPSGDEGARFARSFAGNG